MFISRKHKTLAINAVTKQNTFPCKSILKVYVEGSGQINLLSQSSSVAL